MSIATKEQAVVEKVQKKLYIGGEWRDATGGGTLEVIDPATEEPICEVADATPRTPWPRSTRPWKPKAGMGRLPRTTAPRSSGRPSSC